MYYGKIMYYCETYYLQNKLKSTKILPVQKEAGYQQYSPTLPTCSSSHLLPHPSLPPPVSSQNINLITNFKHISYGNISTVENSLKQESSHEKHLVSQEMKDELFHILYVYKLSRGTSSLVNNVHYLLQITLGNL